MSSPQVEAILSSVKAFIPSLSSQEKLELLNQLSQLLDNSTDSGGISSSQQMTNSLSGVSVGKDFNFQPIQNQDGNISASPNFTSTTVPLNEMKRIFDTLASLKQDIEQSNANPLVKDGAKGNVEKLEEELKKPVPDKGLISRTIETLKQGLEGIQTLATPTLAVAKLVANAWGIPMS